MDEEVRLRHPRTHATIPVPSSVSPFQNLPNKTTPYRKATTLQRVALHRENHPRLPTLRAPRRHHPWHSLRLSHAPRKIQDLLTSQCRTECRHRRHSGGLVGDPHCHCLQWVLCRLSPSGPLLRPLTRCRLLFSIKPLQLQQPCRLPRLTITTTIIAVTAKTSSRGLT